MKRNILLSLLVGMMGVIAFMGCEREQIVPNEGQQQRADVNATSIITSTNNETDSTLFLIGEWVVIASMSEGVNSNYTDTLVFTDSGMIEKHSALSGSQYSIINDSTLRFENVHGTYNVFFRYYPDNGIMFYNFWDNTVTEAIKNIYYERLKL